MPSDTWNVVQDKILCISFIHQVNFQRTKGSWSLNFENDHSFIIKKKLK
jgi:hypothetical protein